jgi:hypothetical protein
MGDVAGTMLGKMLKMQADNRELHRWRASLRSGKEEGDIGLKEFHLKYNKLSDTQTLHSLAAFLD